MDFIKSTDLEGQFAKRKMYGKGFPLHEVEFYVRLCLTKKMEKAHWIDPGLRVDTNVVKIYEIEETLFITIWDIWYGYSKQIPYEKHTLQMISYMGRKEKD